MFERELKRFRSLFREREYIITIHALEEMGEDDVLDEDIETLCSQAKSWNDNSTARRTIVNMFSPGQALVANLWAWF